MKCFLTSDPLTCDAERLNSANGFIRELKAALPARCRAIFICSDPEDYERTERHAFGLRRSCEAERIAFSRFDILDRRNSGEAGALINGAELVILAGGHVPTQNGFFAEIGLRKLMQSYGGVVMGISAGSMNSAELVYAQPEHEGEAKDPFYRRFLPGLALTKVMLLPHYQMLKDEMLDGLRVMEDIAYPDSRGRRFYAIPDGSYLYIEDGREEMRGEAYLIADGELTQISAAGERVKLA